MNKKNLRQENGITLIALVITIIVMLILVAVTINMAVNGGLFGYAGKAVGETKTAIDSEKNLGNIESGLTTEELIEKFTSTPNIHTWTRTGDTFTCSHCNASYTMGDVVTYSPNTGKTETIVYGTDSGHSENQTISRENLTWIVLGLDKDGALLITAKEPTSTVLTLFGKKAYINGPTIMNTVCKELYSNGEFGNARSINIDDVNLALEWTDTRGMVDPVSGDPYKVNAGTKFGDVGTGKMAQADWDAVKDRNQTPEEGKALTDYEIDGYYYYVLEIANINNTRSGAILGSRNTSYWLASRGVFAGAHWGSAYFGPSAMRSVALYSYVEEIFNSYGSEGGKGFGLRPVVPLKSDLPTKANSVVPLRPDLPTKANS